MVGKSPTPRHALDRMNARFHGNIDDAPHAFRAGLDRLGNFLGFLPSQRLGEYQRHRQGSEPDRHGKPAGRPFVNLTPLIPCEYKNTRAEQRETQGGVRSDAREAAPTVSAGEVDDVSRHHRRTDGDDD